MPEDFIPANHDLWTQVFFKIYLNWILRRHYKSIHFFHENRDKPKDKNKASTLVLCNHFSWWDALLIYFWNEKYNGQKFHCMVLRSTLVKNKSLNKVGGYSIEPGKRSVFSSLKYTEELLREPGNMVLLFPQGELYSNHAPYIPFKQGIEKIWNRIQGSADLIFMAGFIDYFSEKKPQVNFYIEYDQTKPGSLGLEWIYNDFYTKSRLNQGSRKS